MLDIKACLVIIKKALPFNDKEKVKKIEEEKG